MLLEWRQTGLLDLTGRHPQPDDLVVPSHLRVMRSVHMNRENLLNDLKRLGLRHRGTHDSRRTFITLARVDGARKDVLEQSTHGARGNILDLYTTLPWPTLCEAVQCLKVRRLSEKECTETLAEIVRANLTATEPDSDESNGQSSNGGNEKQTILLFIWCRRQSAMFVFKAAGSSNGRMYPSGGYHLGSSPSPAALKRNNDDSNE